MAGHDVNGHEPGLQGLAAVHDRPAVTEVSFPGTFRARPATLQSPAPGGSGQRLAARRAQEASSGSKAARDIGRSYFQRLDRTFILPTEQTQHVVKPGSEG